MSDETPSEPAARSTYRDNAACWVTIIRDQLDPYRTELTDGAVIDAVQPRGGLRILDAGCGEGYLTRRLARLGAVVAGVDSCEELVEAAVSAAADERLAVGYRTARLDRLPFNDSSFDVVVCNHVFNDLDDLDRPLKEIVRVLDVGGRLVMLMLHPCFYLPRPDRSAPSSGFDVAQYFAGRTVEQHFRVAGRTSPSTVTVHVRPLEAVVGALAGAGFGITALAEPHPDAAKFEVNPWWERNFPRPMFLLLTAVVL